MSKQKITTKREKGYSLYVRTVAFAMRRYGQNLRKDGKTSHLVHCLSVAEILRNEARITDWKILASAILHDLIEESVTKYEEIEEQFGRRIARIVGELTDNKRLPKAERKREMLIRLPNLSREARLIKLADRLDNVRDPWLITSGIVGDYCKETQRILRVLKNTCPKLEELICQKLNSLRKSSGNTSRGKPF